MTIAQGAEKSSNQVIGRGRTADILSWGDGLAMKLYVAGSRREYVQREARVSRFVHQAGLPAPAVHDAPTADGLFDIDGRLGILYDRVDGESMLRAAARRPWRMRSYAKAFAALHLQIHSVHAAELPRMRVRIEQAVERARSSVPGEICDEAGRRLEQLPDGHAVCHGDFHPDNILLAARGAIVVDWGPASAGHPLADVAWTLLLFRIAGAPPGTPWIVRWLLAVFRDAFQRSYQAAYFERSEYTEAELAEWIGVVAMLRLDDRIEEEHDRLVALIEEEFSEARQPAATGCVQ